MPLKSTSTSSLPEQPGMACEVVFVVDKHNQPLMPCHPARARKLLKKGRADVARMSPFTIRMLAREGGELQETELKVDPGSKATGVALMVKGEKRGWMVVAAWEIQHRGHRVHDALVARAQLRRGRRSRKTRYRAPRFLNRTRPAGWLPPSLRSRIGNVVALAHKMMRLVPLTAIPVEQVKFDTQLLDNPNIEGVAYQQGTLAGYEVREYLLEKWDRQCAYCSARDVPLQVEHIVAVSRGGSARISNLCIACEPCNRRKGAQPVEGFLATRPEVLRRILAQTKAPLRDAAAVNASRKALVQELADLDLPVPTGTGGQTKFNRTVQGYAKQHWMDAACVGTTGAQVDLSRVRAITVVQARGRGSRQMCKPDRYGFPRTGAKAVKRVHGFQTGDRVRLTQPKGKYAGTHFGEVSVRATGMFDITAPAGKITAPHHRFQRLARFDGYAYRRRVA